VKLYYSPRSPYVRKVMVAAHELGLAERLALIEATPQNVIELVSPDNPLGQIPTLVLDDGTALYDSPVVCAYLDTLHEGAPLIPRQGPERWQALRLEALGDAMLDQAIAVFMDQGRAAEQRSEAMLERRRNRLKRCLAVLEGDTAALDGALTIGAIAIACALGYLDFRLGRDFWREGHPALAAWFERFAARASMRATPHPEPG
jgi:glutathione S-transferase